MSPSHVLTVFARLITRKFIILDAGWPLTDGVLSRGLHKKKFFHFIRVYLIDFISFHCSNLILIESKLQKSRIRKYFFVSVKKLRVSLTGLNETAFAANVQFSEHFNLLESRIQQDPKLIRVLFRGKVNNESGIENILQAAEVLNLEAQFIIITNQDAKLKNVPSNCLVSSNLSFNEIKQIYKLSDITLGQISDNARLKYTIPHKAFESGYFKKCYVTPKHEGILEVYDSQSVFFMRNSSSESLVSAIRVLKDVNIRNLYELRINQSYLSSFSQAKLNSKFDTLIEEISSNIFH